MQVEILDMKICPNKRRLATLHVKYYDLLLNCEVVFYAKKDLVWIRMPEHWFNWEKKTSFCRWVNDEISRNFQKDVLNKIFDKYDISVLNFKEIYEQNKRRPNCVDKNTNK